MSARPAAKRPPSATLEALLSSQWPHWTSPNNPGGVLDRVRRIGPIAIDPCGNLASQVEAARELWGTPEIHADLAEKAVREAARKGRREPRAEDITRARQLALDCLARHHQEALDDGRSVELVDGLAASWREGVVLNGKSPRGRGALAYVNPPYGRVLPAWVAKCAAESEAGLEVVLLVPARTDTAWCHDHVFARATGGCFVRGRYNFDNPPPGSDRPGGTFPPLVAFYGQRVDLFFDAFDGAGELFRLQAPREEVTHVG